VEAPSGERLRGKGMHWCLQVKLRDPCLSASKRKLYKFTYLYLPFGHGPWPINHFLMDPYAYVNTAIQLMLV